jgi:LysR family hydrogen peroxide-inducible transcriptional activator
MADPRRDGPGPTLAQLRAFVAVAEELHFGAAATRLGISQPAVSGAVAGLEAALGCSLLERSTRRVLLTRVGEQVAQRARQILVSLDALTEVACEAAEPHTGPLAIGVIPTVAPYLLPVLLPAAHAAFPRLRLDVLEDQTARLLDGLMTGHLDVALMALPSGAGDVVEVPLYEEDFVLLVPAGHPLDGATGLKIDALRQQHLLLLSEGHCLRDQALDICRRTGARIDHPARATSLPTITQLVAGRLGTTLLPETAIAAEARRGKLGLARFADPAPGRRIGLVHRASSGRTAEYRDFAHLARSAVSRLPVRVLSPAA